MAAVNKTKETLSHLKMTRLFPSALVRHIWHAASGAGLASKRDMNTLERVQ